MNIVTVLLWIAAGHGLLLGISLLVVGVKKKSSQLFLGIVLIVCAKELLNAALMPIHYHSRPNAFPFWTLASYLLLPAALFHFVKASTNKEFRYTHQLLWWYLPAGIEIVLEFLAYYFNGIGKILSWLKAYSIWNFYTEILPPLATVLVLGYYWKQLLTIRKMQNRIPVIQQVLFRHYGFLGAIVLLLLFWIGESIFQYNLFVYLELLICLYFFFLAYVIYFKPLFFEVQLITKNAPETPLFATYDDEKEWKRVMDLFEGEKLYRKQRLSLEDVSGAANLPERYISYLINKNHGSNYANFVNAFRVQEVLARMRDPDEKNKTLLGIALDAGFNSKSSFNHIFKTIMGETPSEYLAKLEN